MIIGVLKHALMITGFVLIMMLVIKYINVQTRGTWQRMLRQSRFGQYLLGAFLGVVPGCLGAFTVVSLYSHRTVSFGALVAAMVATSGDEAFLMFSMFSLAGTMAVTRPLSNGIGCGFAGGYGIQKQTTGTLSGGRGS
jgi:hypothetical protein